MNTTPDTAPDTTPTNTAPTNPHVSYNNPRGVPRAKLWLFFFLFFIVGISMYAGTMYRIQNYGYTGIGKDQLAHPENQNGAATAQPQTTTPPQN